MGGKKELISFFYIVRNVRRKDQRDGMRIIIRVNRAR